MWLESSCNTIFFQTFHFSFAARRKTNTITWATDSGTTSQWASQIPKNSSTWFLWEVRRNAIKVVDKTLSKGRLIGGFNSCKQCLSDFFQTKNFPRICSCSTLHPTPSSSSIVFEDARTKCSNNSAVSHSWNLNLLTQQKKVDQIYEVCGFSCVSSWCLATRSFKKTSHKWRQLDTHGGWSNKKQIINLSSSSWADILPSELDNSYVHCTLYCFELWLFDGLFSSKLQSFTWHIKLHHSSYGLYLAPN